MNKQDRNRIIRSLLILTAIVFLAGCSGIAREDRFTPRLEDYKDSGYYAKAYGSGAGYMDQTVPMALLSGDRPKLVLTSSDYEISLTASLKSERLLTIGPCLIVPLPIIPVVFYKHDFTDNIIVIVNGRISSLKGQIFSINGISARVGSSNFEHLELLDKKVVYEYSKGPGAGQSNDKILPLKRETITFSAVVPRAPQAVDEFTVNVQIVEGDRDIAIPSIHLYSSSGTVWAVCFM